MNGRLAGTLVFAITSCCIGSAQTWEIGGAGGFGVPQSLTVSNAGGGSAQAGFTNGYGFSAVLTQRLYKHFSGETRYMYRASDMKVSGNGQEAKLGAESHTLNYDLLLSPGKDDTAVRPFLAAGAGARIYRGTENAPVFQPLNSFAVLTQTLETKPMVDFGAGIKFRMSSRASFRIDFRDFATPVPEKLFATRSTTKLSGWMHDLVFMVGIGYVFHEPGY